MRFSFFIACAFAAVVTEARFGQEQAASGIISQIKITETSQTSGKIATFAGGSISPLLGAADPCAAGTKMDDLITFGKTLSAADSKTVIEAARRALHVEKNFNPFTSKQASICLDATVPKSDELRGILPLVDPATKGADDANKKTTQNLEDIISGKIDGVAQAKGKSIAQQMADVIGFTDIQKFTGKAGGGDAAKTEAVSAATTSAGASATTAPAAGGDSSSTTAAAPASTGAADAGGKDQSAIDKLLKEIEADLKELKTALGGKGGGDDKNAGGAAATTTAGADATTTADAGSTPTAGADAGGAGTTPIKAGLNALIKKEFEGCKSFPTIEFKAGLNEGKKEELRFRPADNDVFSGQSTALNPVIIINFMCDRLNDKCNNKANQAKCQDFKAKATASGDRTGKVADDFNLLWGVQTTFATLGSNANPTPPK